MLVIRSSIYTTKIDAKQYPLSAITAGIFIGRIPAPIKHAAFEESSVFVSRTNTLPDKRELSEYPQVLAR